MVGPSRQERRRADAIRRREGPSRRTGSAAPITLAEARRLIAEGDATRAFDAFETLLRNAPNSHEVRAEFGWFLIDHLPSRPHPVVDPILIAALEGCWIRPELLAVPVVRYLTAKWPEALAGMGADEAQLAGMMRDPLLLALLKATPAGTPALERALGRFRAVAPLAAIGGYDLAAFLPALVALAIRGWHSGYALCVPLDSDGAEEAALHARLAAEIADGKREGNDLAVAIAVCACYAPPPDAVLDGITESNAALRELGTRVIIPRRRQRHIAQDLRPITTFDDSSAIVANQYEQHPYPAWVAEPEFAGDAPRAVLKALGPAGAKTARSVLVAGCGTGQHAIAAARNWPAAAILAVDLSRTALAYGIDKAAQARIDRIAFAQGDILRIEEIGRRFQVIEAVGVLHHLADPAQGLRALERVLAPGGVMKLALYSSAARRNLETVRGAFGPCDGADDAEVRRFRAWALASLDAPEILYSPDFYSIGGCRDLMFHVREHAYTLEEIGILLESAGLRLLALEAPAAAQLLLPAVPGPADTAGWRDVERLHPGLFGSMYQFWACRREG